MSIDEDIASRIAELIGQVPHLSRSDQNGVVQSEHQLADCCGWLAAASNITQIIIPDSHSAYRKNIETIANGNHGWTINNSVRDAGAILENLLADAQTGLVSSVSDHARAEVFDDFLDHAKAYMEDGRKNEAGVIAGVVFEDALRRVCRKLNVEEQGQQLDALISELAKSKILSATKAKRARVSAHVRTKATHAQWDEFDENDVSTAIAFTEEFISVHVEK